MGHDDCDSPNLEGIPRDESPFNDQIQRAKKRPIQDFNGKGKKVAKKMDRGSKMTAALQEYTAMTRKRYTCYIVKMDDQLVDFRVLLGQSKKGKIIHNRGLELKRK